MVTSTSRLSSTEATPNSSNNLSNAQNDPLSGQVSTARAGFVDFGLIVVILLSLLAAIPLVSNAGLPNGNDVLYHAYRVGEMQRSWDNGVFFPRWAEGLYYGYGSPMWHFYGSLTYYITSGLISAFDLTALGALRWLLMASFMMCGVGMYLFMRSQVGRLAGVLAALAYLFSPYIIYTAPYARAVFPELLTLAIFPFVMWRFGRVVQSKSAFAMLTAALVLFLMLITHTLMAAMLTGVLVGWIVWNAVAAAVATPSDQRGRALLPHGMAAIALLVGMALSGYFWIPVLLEGHTVKLENALTSPLTDFRNFFVPADALLGFMLPVDTSAINALRPVTVFGVPQWTLALLGLGGVVFLIGEAIREGRRDDVVLRQGIYFALVALVAAYFLLPESEAAWFNITPLQYILFPWRLFGPVAFALAVLVSMNAKWLEQLTPRIQAGLAGVAVAFILLAAAPAFIVPEWRYEQLNTDIAAYHASETSGLQLGTTFVNEYLPRHVATIPGDNPDLLVDYTGGHPINRANVPPGVSAEVISSSPVANEWRVTTEAGFAGDSFTMEVFTFYWAGWAAQVDGQAVDITPASPHGFITVDVPAGSHTVSVYLGTTAPRIFGIALSIIGIVGLFAIVRFFGGKAPYGQGQLAQPRIERDSQFGLAVAGLLSVAVIFAAGDAGLLATASEAGDAPAQYEVSFTFGDDLHLIGYDLPRHRVSAGDTVRVTLYWWASQASDIDYSSFVHIGLPDTPPIAQEDKLHPGGRAISEWWHPDGYIIDEYAIILPHDMQPGAYVMWVGLYTCELMPPGACGNGYRPPVTDDAGHTYRDILPLVPIVVEER